jgi:adenylate cyclase
MTKRRNTRELYDSFGNAFRSAYHRTPFEALQERLTKTADVQAESAATLGHPEYLNLKVGETRKATAVISFIDIRGFTKLAFTLKNEKILQIVQSLTEAAIRSFREAGGYIGEFTGDGVMAYFGDSHTTDEEATVSALETTSLLFKTVKEIVNPELESDGVPTIRIAAGLEYGEVLWTRIGMDGVSQIKPISRATFLAGKLCAKPTRAWECKVGGDLAAWIPDDFKEEAETNYEFIQDGQKYSHPLYLFDWENFASAVLQNSELVENRVLDKISSARRPASSGVAVTGGYSERKSTSNPSGSRFA